MSSLPTRRDVAVVLGILGVMLVAAGMAQFSQLGPASGLDGMLPMLLVGLGLFLLLIAVLLWFVKEPTA